MSTKRLQSRLSELREEQEKGRRMLAEAEREAEELRATLLRIAGAIQVLEELEAEADTGEDDRPEAAAE